MKLCLKLALVLALTFSIARSALDVASVKQAVSWPSCIPFSFPRFLVDGSILTLATTMPGANPYLAVDLGQAFQVLRVVLSGHLGVPLSTYNVGVTNTDPGITDPAPSNYNLCLQFVFSIPVEPRTIFCPLNLYPRRWVIFQQIIPFMALSLAEMEVYAAQKRATSYEKSEGQRVVKDLALIGIPFIVAKRVDCMVPCLKSENCDSFNFRASDHTCELHDWDKGVTSADVTADPDWDLWQPTYTAADL